MKRFLHLIIAIFTLSVIAHPAKANGKEKDDLLLNSDSAVLIDAKTGQILYQKNSQSSMYPASITKIATAIYAIEHGDLNGEVTVSKNARNTDGTKVFLEEGEKVTLERLIQGMLINSGNDAAVAIAEHLSGSVSGFSHDLNRYLQTEIGTSNTNFKNPNGLFDPEHRTTAEDMAKITKYALKNREFAKIFGTKSLKWEGETWNTTIFTHHKMMMQQRYDGVTGGKNGFVSQAGYTLVTAAERNGLSLITVTMKSPNDQGTYDDTKKLLDFGFGRFETGEIRPTATLKNDRQQPLQLNHAVYYTKHKGEHITSEVSKANELFVKGEDGRKLASAKLESAVPDGQGITPALKRDEMEKDEALMKGHFFIAVLMAFLLVIGVGGAVFLQTKKWQ
ncbi:D-alanyl-D-alanine carboxypeptidase [Bacillus sp. FJAT-42376]|uniref:D-alanyl-D-alanine carboxypeptidase family protein n=1 Tax=Bacillus sp. FJAT-42376 TaxID=2014076 RepID=UPI000F511247|nr:D-alanyl-D-alanine carboxypeptidase family protein [Bacillus sp. FJAT-42376]AZB44340.1 D-alanyl-D-alanine carboxypeptidase [Bacillus sp. FJAT-42376]